MPPWITYFNNSTLASSITSIANSKKIRLSGGNTISANLNNADTIVSHSNPNNVTGNFSNNASSVIWFDGNESHSYLIFSNGFTNNGKILFDANYYYGYLKVTSGVLTNSASGVIKTQGNPYSVGYYQLEAAVNNLGLIDVGYYLRHYTNPGASHNTASISIAANYSLDVYNGTWHWDGGTPSGTGLLRFFTATGSFNTASMPAFITYFNNSTLASGISGISNTKKIRLSGSNTISANLNNTDTIVSHSNPNAVTGTFTNTTASVIWFDGNESHSYLTFSNGFTNNGKILFDANYYYGYMKVTAGVLINSATGIIKTQGNPYSVAYYQL